MARGAARARMRGSGTWSPCWQDVNGWRKPFSVADILMAGVLPLAVTMSRMPRSVLCEGTRRSDGAFCLREIERRAGPTG
jgi:hypothetical protein